MSNLPQSQLSGHWTDFTHSFTARKVISIHDPTFLINLSCSNSDATITVVQGVRKVTVQ